MRNLFLLIFLVLAWSVVADVNEKQINYNYYTANADPSRSLTDILNASSPIRENDKLFFGYTKWNIKWNYNWHEKPNGRCKLTRVTVDFSSSIQLPKLNGGSTKQRKQFDKFLPALRTHELGHYKFGKDAAIAIDRKISSLPEMSSCKELGSTANKLGEQILNEYKKKEKQYDTSTSHGKTQGAWLEN